MDKVCLVGCTDLVIDEHATQARLGEAIILEGDPHCLDVDAGVFYTDSPKVISGRPESLIKRVTDFRAQVGQDCSITAESRP